jgi:hypothetical protein
VRVDTADQSDVSALVSTTRSLLDADFDDLVDGETDEISIYMVERLAHRDTNVLNWWKVSRSPPVCHWSVC